MCSPMAPCGPDEVVMKPIFTVCADAGATPTTATRSPARTARLVVVVTIGASCWNELRDSSKRRSGLENLAAAIPGRHLEAEAADLRVDIILVHAPELGVAPPADPVGNSQVAEARLRLADRVDPALERHVERVDRMLAHAAPQERVGLGLALRSERAQQATVDESLMRLVGRDLRLDVAILGRGPLVDPGMVLLDRRELGRRKGRQELQDDLAIFLGHLLDRLDLAHAEQDAPLDSARD